MRLRRLRFGLSTLFGARPLGFFIPYRYAGLVPRREERSGYVALEPIFAAAEPAFAGLLQRMASYGDRLKSIGGAPPEPRWTQDWFPRLDAAALYTLIRERKPARIVEVGSGHSTRFMGRAIRDGALATRLTAIDPAPRADIAGTGATLLRQIVQDAGPEAFNEIVAGDMLFIDSSHVLMPGTDVDLVLNHILPRLPRGVIVHVHDILLPDEYPPEWTWRGYNEQLAVATLMQGGSFRLLWSSRYVATRMAAAVAASVADGLPLVPGALETSLWLEKT